MAEYRRFISYIYAYEGDMKTKNVGFAKIEARNGQCRISISVKGAYECSGKALVLYGYGGLSDRFLLVPIGKIPVKNGVGEAVFGKNEDDLGGSGLGLDFIRGLYLRSEASARKAYLTTWDDSIIHISSLRNAREAGENETDQETAPVLKAAEVEAECDRERPEGAETEKPEETEPESVGTESVKTEILESESAKPESRGPETVKPEGSEAEGSEAVLAEREAAASSGGETMESRWDETFRGRMPDEFYYREGFTELPLWECLQKVLPRKLVLAEEGWEVLQIHLQDIGRLPRENWAYGNNSFVLHGYYQYRYLILARRKREKKEKFQAEHQYILGVPGIFKPQEKFMASMFGLPDFKRAAGHREENFGFWCGSVRLS